VYAHVPVGGVAHGELIAGAATGQSSLHGYTLDCQPVGVQRATPTAPHPLS
jgi:hypothetical protein